MINTPSGKAAIDRELRHPRRPLQMADLATQLESGHRFDSIVVDEAQDFADAWWDPLLAALKDADDGGLHVFTDEGQRVFSRYGSPPVPLVPLILDHNLRNTRQIADAFQQLVDHPMRFLGGEGRPSRSSRAAATRH
jgi:hypothetical protein